MDIFNGCAYIAGMKNSREKFLIIGKVEGWSYLILLFIAMPMKYMFDMPLAVRIVGSVHGLLFVAYVVLLATIYFKLKLSLYTVFILFVLSLLPFGTFYLEKFLPEIKVESN